jgi:hypothetical protein
MDKFGNCVKENSNNSEFWSSFVTVKTITNYSF